MDYCSVDDVKIITQEYTDELITFVVGAVNLELTNYLELAFNGTAPETNDLLTYAASRLSAYNCKMAELNTDNNILMSKDIDFTLTTADQKLDYPKDISVMLNSYINNNGGIIPVVGKNNMIMELW